MFRHRLLMVVLLGAVVSTLSLVALIRAVSTVSASLRVERAEQAVAEALDELAKGRAVESTYVGLRAGMVAAPPDVAAVRDLPATWRAPLTAVLEEARARGGRVAREIGLGESMLVLAAQPLAGGGLAWTGYQAFPSALLGPWRWIALALALVTALLVATTVWGAVAFRRASKRLHATLLALGRDLSTPVPTPRIAELTGIADGIRRMAADLKASRQASERHERLAALGRVAAGVAHEVRNPLASIKLRLDLTAATAELPAEARKAIEAASHEVERLDHLVSDLLVVAGKKMGPRRAVDLGELVRERAEALGPWAGERRIQLRASGTGSAEIDAESIARAVDNLLRNAVEASPPGGAASALVATRGDRIEVTVEDTGSGIDPARAAELFEPFFTTKAEGTGLGLAISRAIARAHGGDLRYARADERTRFVLSLPRAAGEDRVAA